jgi:hypothetical protein
MVCVDERFSVVMERNSAVILNEVKDLARRVGALSSIGRRADE